MPVPLEHRFRVVDLPCFVDNPVQIVLRTVEERYQVDYSGLYCYCSFDTTDASDDRRVHSWVECPLGRVFERFGVDWMAEC
jgi:hypothetical protein